MSSLREYITKAFSTKSIGIFLLILTSVFITIILASKYYLHHNIIENGVSKRDVVANRTIEIIDTEKTQKLKQEMAKKVLPILVPVQDNFIKINLDKNISKIESIKTAPVPLKQKKDELIGYFNLSQNNQFELSQIDYILQISNSHFDNIAIATQSTLLSILEKGVTDSDIQDKFDKILKENISSHLIYADKKTVAFLISNVIAPNVVTDDEATEAARKNALNAVKPVEVTFQPGDKIVSQGQIVSKLQRDAIRQCGYNIIQLNASGIMGIFILVFLSLFACAYHIEHYEPALKRKAHYTLVSFLMLLISLGATLLPPNDYYILMLPFTAFTILIAIFLNTKVATVVSIALLCSVGLALQLELGVIEMFVFGVFATVFAMNKIDYTARMDLVKVGFSAGIVYVLCVTGTYFLNYNFEDLSFQTYGMAVITVFLNAIFSSMIALGMLPLLEVIFKIPTTYGLMELANSNNPLLQKLQEKAPGTHHHSQMVAILAEAAAEAVGANATLTRIGAIYHDIGKMNRPLFFIENQTYYGIENPHDHFSPKFSKMVITTHPRDGVEIAKEYNLSPSIYPFILEHHGDSVASYFYNEAVKAEGAENVSEDEYRYNAPRPSSKESAIVMLADGVESAVRSLKNASFDEIDKKVNSIINGKLLDGQLSDSPLTLKDLKTISATFNRVLKGMHHQRIKYHEDFETIQEKIANSEGEKSDN